MNENPQSVRALHPVDREIAVKFDSVFFSYGNVPVLENASFHIHKGEFVALVGPNGSGKTTILKLLLGLEQPVSGRIEVFGGDKPAVRPGRGPFDGSRKPPTNYDRGTGPDSGDTPAERKTAMRAWQGRLGYVPQQPPADQAFPITVRDVVRMGLLRRFGAYAAGEKAAADAAMEQAGIGELAERPYRALSGGQRRRVLVARALAAGPEIFVLDEPTANMDSESEGQLFETLGKLKGHTTVLIVTHDTDFVSVLTDRVLCLGIDEDKHRSIVQHRTEAAGKGGRHGESAVQEARVLHNENIPADDCYE